MMLALGTLALAVAGSSAPVCAAAKAEALRSALESESDHSGLAPIPVEHEMMQQRFERLMVGLRHWREEYFRRRQIEDDNKWRKRPRGDFWSQGEIGRHFGR
jgi:hypothetical protein